MGKDKFTIYDCDWFSITLFVEHKILLVLPYFPCLGTVDAVVITDHEQLVLAQCSEAGIDEFGEDFKGHDFTFRG